MEIRIEKGIVISFDLITLRGKIIAIRNGKKFKFHSTCFQSAPPTRFPLIGEMVKMAFSRGKLVSVRSD